MNTMGTFKDMEKALEKLQDIYDQRRLIPRRLYRSVVRNPRTKAKIIKVRGQDDK